MKIKCDYCGNTYEDTASQCPNCGAPNPSHQNSNNPKTIEELKIWYRDRNLPAPEVTRFFIGVDYKEPKAFGIFKDANGEFVVYKNKADGTRAIRYKGKDEEYAVNELLQRLKDEIVHQKNLNSNKESASKNHPVGLFFYKFHRFFFKSFFVIGILSVILSFIIAPIQNRHNGYYLYNGSYYYDYQDNWYVFDDDWYEVPLSDNAPSVISTNYDDYYVSDSWNSSIATTDWNNTSYYENFQSSDSDYDWDSNDSWDSNGTDWDSDW
ncbi:zinc ribbon domain-containing protein [Butyrivibrio sp. NC2002]|uniref:zinc ribbon domain-containing protein n=1 Tax=Butyrivibrio sp. NC2002 TaxID=1410610 RepID=UPI0005600A97|nr:zinc ribbon domain-containing protein [Butyrivibrio sp. NC2002]